MTTLQSAVAKLRLLVVIASFGGKNVNYLREIINAYRSMSMYVDVIVLSDAPKDLGGKVEVVVGLPDKNPWSLPFAHKAIFAEKLNEYDLFAYSEDDMYVSEANIRAFLRATLQLRSDEIAGFLRYEVKESGGWSLPEVHGTFHWRPYSVRRRGDYTIAEFTNEHAGFYLLTQNHLHKAIASGGFLRGPCRGLYGWPETAATDPYTNCGFHKVICISVLEDFLIHHMPNRYTDKFGLPLEMVKNQIETLDSIQKGTHPARMLCKAQSKMPLLKWSKGYYEAPCEPLLRMVPAEARSILSIGCGWGETEVFLQKRGAKVTALPIDSVVGAMAASHGIEVIHGELNESLTALEIRRFDVVIIVDMLHLQPHPEHFIEQCSRFVALGGVLLLSGPNFGRFPLLAKRNLANVDFQKMRNFDQSGITTCSPRALEKHLKGAGFHDCVIRWMNHSSPLDGFLGTHLHLRSLTARDWVMLARR